MTGKRYGAALLLLALSTALLTGCTGKADAATARIAVLKGPTAMGMVQLMDEAERAENSPYSFTLAGSPDELTPKLIRGELDMAALPANLAAVLHQNSGGRIRMLAVNTLGVLDIVGRAPAPSDFSGLKGRTIYAAGKGSSPEFVLRDLMQEAGLNPDMDVELRWNSEHSEVTAELAAALKRGEDALALLPQPFVTAALDAVEGLSVLLELNDEWALRHPDSSLVTGVLAVRADYAEQHPEAVEQFLRSYATSTDYTNAHPEEAAQLIERYGILKADVAARAIPYCHITCLTGAEAKRTLSGYLEVLYAAEPEAVGGSLPGADFYYGA